jgi:hypothetical protein
MNLIQSTGLPVSLTYGRVPSVGELRGKIWIVRSYGNDIAGSYPLFGS